MNICLLSYLMIGSLKVFFFYTNGEPMRICYDGYSENEIRFEHFGVIVRGSAIGVGVTTIGIELLIGSMGSLRHISEL